MANKWKFFWAASLAFVVFFQACGTHSWEEWVISIDQEKQMGREFDSLVRLRDKDVMAADEDIFTPQNDAQQALDDFYQARAKEVLGVIDADDWKSIMPSSKLCGRPATACSKNNFFEFKIIKSKTVNAFAVPGGYVYFYTAILKNFQSESELMSVLGHEIGHVILHHSRDRMVKAAGASAVISVFLGDGIAGLIGTLGANFWLLDNSQENESSSDSMGFYYTNKIGISSIGLSDFFGRGLKDPDGKDCKADNSVLDVFSTHPPSCERVKKNRERMEAANQTFETHPRDRETSKIGGKNFKELVSAAGI